MKIQIVKGLITKEENSVRNNLKLRVEIFGEYMNIFNFMTLEGNFGINGEVIYIGKILTMIEMKEYIEEQLGHKIEPLEILEEVELQEI